MSSPYRTLRVFISSTFRDMQAERDHLVRFVFPRLRERLLANRVHLVDVDLRWGVTSEQDALEVCREVIDECRPRFLCLLGGRYGWVPPGRTHSITAEEVHYGVLDRGVTGRARALFYFRDPSATARMVERQPGEYREPEGSTSARALEDLKEAIVRAGFRPAVYSATGWDGGACRLVGLQAFGDRVYADLLRGILDELGPESPEPLTHFDEERAAMDAFVEERAQRFVLGSREPVWNALLAHAHGPTPGGLLCLVGEPGSGKSALLAQLSRSPSLVSHPSILVVSHFVGASAGSTDMRRTLRRMCHELMVATGMAGDIPEEPDPLRAFFQRVLAQACRDRRVVILLDAVDQFSPTREFPGLWLPEALPEDVRVIASALAGPALDDLRRRTRPPRVATLGPLTSADGKAIVDAMLRRYRKSMTDAQRAELLSKTDADKPLYLLAALEELRTLGTYAEISARIVALPAETVTLFRWMLKRLEQDDGFRDAGGRAIGSELVPRFAAALAVSRHGLSEREIAELLRAEDVHGNVAALLRLIRPYLMHRGDLLDFFHRQLQRAAEEEYVPDPTRRAASHALLASYFLHQAEAVRDGTWKGFPPRGLSELIFHLQSAGMWNELVSCLRDPGLFELLPASAYGLTYDRGWYFGRDPDAIEPDVVSALPGPRRREIGFALADAFVAQARCRIEKTKRFAQPWPETADRLRESSRAAFADYRDTFYSFVRLAERAADFAVAALDGSPDVPARVRAFLERSSDVTAFHHMLHHSGAEETGLSHALEDDSSIAAWERLRRV